VTGKESVAIVTGKDSKASGSLGCWIVLTERDDNYNIVMVKAVKVDGKKIKENVIYKLVNKKIIEA
jgi:pantoate kinase